MSLGPRDVCWACQMGDHEECNGRDIMGHICGCCGRKDNLLGRLMELNMPPIDYKRTIDLLRKIDGTHRTAILSLYFEIQRNPSLKDAPGSRRAHQAWQGGYLDHVSECLNIAYVLYTYMNLCRPLPFSLSDALLVLFLHDLEKPWLYAFTNEVPEDVAARRQWIANQSKADRKSFREAKIRQYEIELTPEQQNALRYCEGEGDDYIPGMRVMGPLAAFCHMVDVASARIWHDEGRDHDWRKKQPRPEIKDVKFTKNGFSYKYEGKDNVNPPQVVVKCNCGSDTTIPTGAHMEGCPEYGRIATTPFPPDMIEPIKLPECKLPPKGWFCTRGAGHPGPCPARPESERLEYLLKFARNLPKMSPEEEREQRISFAYGNAKLANPNITREMVEEAAHELDAHPRARASRPYDPDMDEV